LFTRLLQATQVLTLDRLAKSVHKLKRPTPALARWKMIENLRRSLVLSRGDPMIFFQRPISATLLGLCVLVLVITGLRMWFRTRPKASRS
jgi:hypothetical protein